MPAPKQIDRSRASKANAILLSAKPKVEFCDAGDQQTIVVLEKRQKSKTFLGRSRCRAETAERKGVSFGSRKLSQRERKGGISRARAQA